MQPISKEALGQLFSEARTHHGWATTGLPAGIERMLYDLVKWGPTSVNGGPGRFLFLRPGRARDPLLATLMEKNVAKTRRAPITVVVAYDPRWLDTLGILAPQANYRPYFEATPGLTETTAFRNSSLQGAYFILAARALGLDCGPMSGFDNARLDAAYFKESGWRSNFIINIGYGEAAKLHPRAPRLAFEEACRIL